MLHSLGLVHLMGWYMVAILFRLVHLSMVLAHLMGCGMVWDLNSFRLVCLSLGLAHLMGWCMVGMVV